MRKQKKKKNVQWSVSTAEQPKLDEGSKTPAAPHMMTKSGIKLKSQDKI